MKWFSIPTYRRHLADLKEYKTGIGRYYEWVTRLANQKPKEYSAIGILDTNDLIQAGHIGLAEAWQKIDWERIELSSEPEAELWSFLKRRIKWAIQREIDQFGAHIKVPRRDLEEARNRMEHHDKILCNLFPNFFDTAFANMIEEITPWDQMRLGELIDEMLYTAVPNADHRMIVRLCFGLDTDDDKPWPMKKIAEKYDLTVSNIQNIKHRCIKRLRTEDNKKIIENFYENQ